MRLSKPSGRMRGQEAFLAGPVLEAIRRAKVSVRGVGDPKPLWPGTNRFLRGPQGQPPEGEDASAENHREGW